MYFSLFDFCIRKDLKMIGLLTFSFRPKETGDRNLISFRWDREENVETFGIHFLWNWNYTWYKKSIK